MLWILAFQIWQTSPALAELRQWNTHSLSIQLPCAEELPDFSFELHREYRPENAFMLLWASSLAENLDRPSIQKGLQAWGFQESTLIGSPQKGAYAYLAEDPEFNLLAFRGTNSWQETLADAFFLPKTYGSIGFSGLGHQGMMYQFQKLLKQSEPLLKRKDPGQNKPLLIAGHSLGGAVALLHAMHFAKTGWDVMGVYTSAQPRVGNEAFYQDVERWLPNRYYRMEADVDLIPRLPPSQVSSDKFSRIVPDPLKQVQTALRNFVEGMKYALPSGSRMRIGSVLEVQQQERNEDDLDFWEGLRGSVSNGQNFPEVIEALRGRFGIHPPPHYMCAFLKALRS